MAGSGSDPGDPRFDSPETPRMVLRDGAPDELSPDTEQNVAGQTETVFRSFVCHMNAFDRSGQQEADDTPSSLPEEELTTTAAATNHQSPSFSAAGQIGRQLAIIGDAINERHASQFNRMIRLMNLTPETAYDAFAGVARKLFRDGNITWGRVITLLCFGYRMAVSVLQRRMRGFFTNVVEFLARFILTERIAKWIADQGGWRAVLSYIPEQIGWSTVGLVVTIAAITVLTVICLTTRRQQ